MSCSYFLFAFLLCSSYIAFASFQSFSVAHLWMSNLFFLYWYLIDPINNNTVTDCVSSFYCFVNIEKIVSWLVIVLALIELRMLKQKWSPKQDYVCSTISKDQILSFKISIIIVLIPNNLLWRCDLQHCIHKVKSFLLITCRPLHQLWMPRLLIPNSCTGNCYQTPASQAKYQVIPLSILHVLIIWRVKLFIACAM